MQTSCGPTFGGMFTRCYLQSVGSFLENFKEHCTSHVNFLFKLVMPKILQ
jgi:hypothetical protein